jgi:hypothetical protein
VNRITIGALLALGTIPVSALASAPGAWLKLEREVTRKCIIASDLRRPDVSKMIIFDDSVGKVAVLVTGTYRRGQAAGTRTANLCLYDRRTKAVSSVEARGWSDAGNE